MDIEYFILSNYVKTVKNLSTFFYENMLDPETQN